MVNIVSLLESNLLPANKYGYRNAIQPIRLGPGEYQIDKEVDLTKAYGLSIVGSGPTTIVYMSNGACLNLLGSVRTELGGMELRSTGGVDIGIKLGRTSIASSHFHYLHDLMSTGPFNTTVIWNAASECNSFVRNNINNDGPGSCLNISNYMPGSFASTMLQMTVQDCQFACNAAGNVGAIRIIKQDQAIVGDLYFTGGGMSITAKRPCGVSLEYLGVPGQLQDIHFEGCRWEADETDHAMTLNSGGTVTRLSLRDMTSVSKGALIYGPGSSLSNFVADNINGITYSQSSSRPWFVAAYATRTGNLNCTSTTSPNGLYNTFFVKATAPAQPTPMVG